MMEYTRVEATMREDTADRFGLPRAAPRSALRRRGRAQQADADLPRAHPPPARNEGTKGGTIRVLKHQLIVY